jgi:hypothetical protein
MGDLAEVVTDTGLGTLHELRGQHIRDPVSTGGSFEAPNGRLVTNQIMGEPEM